jgi:hypothetical protein
MKKWTILLGVAAWAVFLIVGAPQVASLWKLNKDFQTTRAVVVAFDPNEHNKASYRYRVDDKEYDCSFFGQESRVGSRVKIFYSTKDPKNVSLQEPGAALRDAILGCLLVGTFVIGVSLVAANRWWGRNVE